ncbi:IS1/IS1595 family N-terminal zinc-binding domain-containing protein [Bacillus sp. Hm123]|uniref:IS1/IS1595 family N-terminal zinc-binding domain-containing protein n=1 Tax=Bacillus sp. Hm123 TaxID=3450745 RepID=UPI003F42E81D
MEAINLKCIYCGCLAHKHGKTDNGKRRYKCSNLIHCGKTFTEVGYKKVFIIECPKCKKEIEGFRSGRVWYVDAKGIRKHRYQCSVCGVKTVKFCRVEEREKN